MAQKYLGISLRTSIKKKKHTYPSLILRNFMFLPNNRHAFLTSFHKTFLHIANEHTSLTTSLIKTFFFRYLAAKTTFICEAKKRQRRFRTRWLSQCASKSMSFETSQPQTSQSEFFLVDAFCKRFSDVSNLSKVDTSFAIVRQTCLSTQIDFY